MEYAIRDSKAKDVAKHMIDVWAKYLGADGDDRNKQRTVAKWFAERWAAELLTNPFQAQQGAREDELTAEIAQLKSANLKLQQRSPGSAASAAAPTPDSTPKKAPKGETIDLDPDDNMKEMRNMMTQMASNIANLQQQVAKVSGEPPSSSTRRKSPAKRPLPTDEEGDTPEVSLEDMERSRGQRKVFAGVPLTAAEVRQQN